jgi:hypothetical protein
LAPDQTPEVVDAIVEQDLLRLLLPRSLGGQEIHLLAFCKTTEAVAWGDAGAGWFVNQSNVSSAASVAAMAQHRAACVISPCVISLRIENCSAAPSGPTRHRVVIPWFGDTVLELASPPGSSE